MKYSFRDALFVMAIAAILVAWFLDRRSQEHKRKEAELALELATARIQLFEPSYRKRRSNIQEISQRQDLRSTLELLAALSDPDPICRAIATKAVIDRKLLSESDEVKSLILELGSGPIDREP
jgi:hypothetical protein